MNNQGSISLALSLILAVAGSQLNVGAKPVLAQSSANCATFAEIVDLEGTRATYIQNGFSTQAYKGAILCGNDRLSVGGDTTAWVRCNGDASNIRRRVNGVLAVREICAVSPSPFSVPLETKTFQQQTFNLLPQSVPPIYNPPPLISPAGNLTFRERSFEVPIEIDSCRNFSSLPSQRPNALPIPLQSSLLYNPPPQQNIERFDRFFEQSATSYGTVECWR